MNFIFGLISFITFSLFCIVFETDVSMCLSMTQLICLFLIICMHKSFLFHLLCHYYYLLSLIFTVIIISKLKLELCYVLMQNIKLDEIYKIVVGIIE